MKSKLIAVALASLLPLPLGAQGTTHFLHIYNFDFSINPAGEPVAAPTIQPGDTVRWIWDQGFHSTTAALGQLEYWDSPVQSGGTFDHTFTQIGTFHYYSRPFGFDNGDGSAGGMSGTVVVVPEPTTTALCAVGALLAWAGRRKPRSTESVRDEDRR